jgi:DNA-binding Lrp family transcriptional regulator
MAEQPEISHCYERPRFPGWPYNLFGMIHGTSPEQVLDVAAKVAGMIHMADYRVLFSVREFKKSSMVFFSEE